MCSMTVTWARMPPYAPAASCSKSLAASQQHPRCVTTVGSCFRASASRHRQWPPALLAPRCPGAPTAPLAEVALRAGLQSTFATRPAIPGNLSKLGARGCSSPPAAAGRDAAMSIVEPTRLISALDKLARVGQVPEPMWLDMYLAIMQPVLSQLSLREMAILARALTRLGVQVPEPWARALLQASEAALGSAESAADVAGLVVWAAADGAVVPESGWIGAALHQIQALSLVLAASSSPALTPVEAADVAWAVARMGYRPVNPLLDCLAAASQGLPYGNDAVESRVPESQRRTGHRDYEEEEEEEEATWDPQTPNLDQNPDSEIADSTAEGLDDMGDGDDGLSKLPPEQLARLAWAFASYNYFPADEWVQSYWLRCVCVPGLSPEGATAVMWSFGVMQLQLEALWLRKYCLTTTGRLHEIPPEGLINGLWAIAACREVAHIADEANAAATTKMKSSPVNAVAHGYPGTPDSASVASTNTSEAVRGAAEKEEEEQLRQAGLDDVTAFEELQEQLEALLSLRDDAGVTGVEQEDLTRLQEAIDRRLAAGVEGWEGATKGPGGGGRAAAAVLPPPEWVTEWFSTTLQYIDLQYMDKTLVIKALWAVAMLELAPPPAWLRRVVEVAAVLLADGALEPLELLYASRSADAMLARRLPQRAARHSVQPAVTKGVVKQDEAGEEEEGEGEARASLGRFVADSFETLGRPGQLPMSWRRLNPRFPPYAQPRPGAEGPLHGESEAGEGPGSSRERIPGTGAVSSRRMLGPVVPGAALLRPFG